MRYFLCGVSRLILESEPLPQIILIFIKGMQRLRHESRGLAWWVPRVAKGVGHALGMCVWGLVSRELKTKSNYPRLSPAQQGQVLDHHFKVGELMEGMNCHPVALWVGWRLQGRYGGRLCGLGRVRSMIQDVMIELVQRGKVDGKGR